VKVIAAEVGERPRVLTNSRRFAPEGVKLLAETLGRFEFADEAGIVLDWSNVMGEQPDEVAKPVVYIETTKHVEDKVLTVKVRLDVEDTFGRDTIMADDFLMIIRQMEDKTNDEVAYYLGG
jgi:hypothetical protein